MWSLETFLTGFVGHVLIVTAYWFAVVQFVITRAHLSAATSSSMPNDGSITLRFCHCSPQLYRRVMMGVPNPSSQLIFSQNPSSQLLEFLQSQLIIRKFRQIPKSQLIFGNKSQFPAIFKGQSHVPVNGHQDPLIAYGFPCWNSTNSHCSLFLESLLLWFCHKLKAMTFIVIHWLWIGDFYLEFCLVMNFERKILWDIRKCLYFMREVNCSGKHGIVMESIDYN